MDAACRSRGDLVGNIAGRTQTLPLLVYSELESDVEAATWTSLILIAVALITLLLIQSLDPIPEPPRQGREQR